MLIYISGRIRDNPEHKNDFLEAEHWLRKKGFKAINPSNLDTTFPDLTYQQYMSIDYKLIEMSDGIFMLHDWEKSKGACAELSYAKSLGKKVIYQDYYGRGKRNG